MIFIMDVDCIKTLVEKSVELNEVMYEGLQCALDLLEENPGSQQTRELNEIVAFLNKAIHRTEEYIEEMKAHIPRKSFYDV